MSSRASERIMLLFEKVSDLDKQGGVAAGIAAGFDMLEDYFDELYANLFPDTMSERQLRNAKALFSIDRHTDDELARQMICDKMKEHIRPMLPNEFDILLGELDESIEYSAENYVLTISGASKLPRDKIKGLQNIVDRLVPPFVFTRLSGEGMTFREWDIIDVFPFEKIDNMNLSFNIIETLDKEEE